MSAKSPEDERRAIDPVDVPRVLAERNHPRYRAELIVAFGTPVPTEEVMMIWFAQSAAVWSVAIEPLFCPLALVGLVTPVPVLHDSHERIVKATLSVGVAV